MPWPSEPIVDRGGQAERTRLSWNRTGLALAVNAGLLAHVGSGSVLRQVPALVLLIGALGCFLFAGRRYRQINVAVRTNSPVTSIRYMRVSALLVVFPAVIALVLVLLP